VAVNPSNDKKTFQLAHQNIINMTGGLIYDEDALVLDVDHGYGIAVVKDGYVKLEPRSQFSNSGGDYSINYTDGYVTLFEEAESTITVDYSYATDSMWVIRPYEGKYLDITKAKLQWTADVEMTTSVIYSVVGNAEVFAPEYVAANRLAPTDKVPLMNTVYNKFTQMLDEAADFCPPVPPNPGPRGFGYNLYAAIFEFDTVKHLTSSAGMELRITLGNDVAFNGEHCSINFRCISDYEVVV
jgi:hypothetical protein